MYSKNLDNLYNSKYLKYKNKYLSLKKLVGGVRHKMVFINFDGVEWPNPDNPSSYFNVDENLVLQNYVAESLNMPPESIFLSFNSNFISSNNLSIDPIKSSTRLKDILGDNIRTIEIDVESLVELNINYNGNNNICYVRKNDLIKKVVGDCLKKNPGELHVSMGNFTIQDSEYVHQFIFNHNKPIIIELTVSDGKPQSSSMSTSAVPWSSKSTPDLHGNKSLTSAQTFVPTSLSVLPPSFLFTDFPRFTDGKKPNIMTQKELATYSPRPLSNRQIKNRLKKIIDTPKELTHTISRTKILSNIEINSNLTEIIDTLKTQNYNIDLDFNFQGIKSDEKNDIYINIYFKKYPRYSGTISFHNKNPSFGNLSTTHIKWYACYRDNTLFDPISNKEEKMMIRTTELKIYSVGNENSHDEQVFIKKLKYPSATQLSDLFSPIEDIILNVLYEVLLKGQYSL